jgi:hypothetical protein
MNLEKVPYKGWINCIEISSGLIKLVVTTDVGPRIIHAGYRDGINLFYENPQQLGTTGGDDWKIYGGHRLWCAPEDRDITYAPDNFQVSVDEQSDQVRFTAPAEKTGVQKVLEILPGDTPQEVVINHVIHNNGSSPISLAPWALTVMKPGGLAIIPHHLKYSDQLTPSHSISLWGYTDMSDKRWRWGDRYILLKQDPNAMQPQKIGLCNLHGWAAYSLDNQLFVKKFTRIEGDTYPDFGCNFEAYTNNEILELETLGPLRELQPGQSTSHQETWSFFSDVPKPDSEQDVDQWILPLIQD